MSKNTHSITERLRIFQVRGQPVALDRDLAMVYGVETKALNRAAARNAARFPKDFLFRLTPQELTALKFQIGTSNGRGGRRSLPWAFTEHGAIMAATVLNSPRAVAMSVYVVRAFVRLRAELLASATMEKRLAEIEKTLIHHDSALRDIYERIRPLLLPPAKQTKRRIGFHNDPE